VTASATAPPTNNGVTIINSALPGVWGSYVARARFTLLVLRRPLMVRAIMLGPGRAPQPRKTPGLLTSEYRRRTGYDWKKKARASIPAKPTPQVWAFAEAAATFSPARTNRCPKCL
jgi:hypothetical protein